MLKGLLFDMDGVLVDNLEIHKQAFGIFFERYGLHKSAEELSRVFGMGNDDIMRAVMPHDIIESVGLRELGYEKEAIYRELYAPKIHPVAGLTDLLAACETAGVKCAVGSSGCTDNVNFVLDSCNLRRYFSATVAGDKVSKCKPDPEIYLTAAAAIGVDPSQCVVFEDAEAGIEAGKRAGMKVIALSTTFTADFLAATQADMIIADFTQIDIERIDALLSE